ncbi:hypothetical protein V6N11_076580 [Hibiscus sabdariffa]|uniref:Reverse transcriptase zinc-binding domain-containing protein n=1 Tax=Hibiscus sabdariffa TaxID=183260 RepID=A0ABR2Q6R4_9ROSI
MLLCRTFPCWLPSVSGQFQVRLAYAVRIRVSFGPKEHIWKAIAHFKDLPRVRTFIWLRCLGKMLANDERLRRHLMTECRSMCGGGEYIVEFFSLPFKDWLLTNLTNFEKFVSDGVAWDLLFGGMCGCSSVSCSKGHAGDMIFQEARCGGSGHPLAIEAGLWGIYEGVLTAWLVGVLRASVTSE